MEKVIHPGAHLITPYQQGQLDSLCGLYALLNAICVIHAPFHPLSGKATRSLFVAATRKLASDARLRAALHDGMSPNGQHRLAKALFSAPILVQRPTLIFQVHKPRLKTSGDFEHFVAATIKRGAVLLVCFEGRMSHHTTITGISAQRLILADSSGMQFIYSGSFSFSANTKTGLRLTRVATLGV
jgi:hypothetical protein